MAASNRYFNVTGVKFTPTGGTLINFTGAKKASLNYGISVKRESGDANQFETVQVTEMYAPKVSISGLDAFGLQAIGGVAGVLEYTVPDANNGVAVAGGGKKVTLANAMVDSQSIESGHREYGMQSAAFGCVSSDGSTSPITVTSL